MNSASADLPPLAGAPFIGFMVGCILFGCTLLQAYQYFMNYVHDSLYRKVFIVFVCSLDTLDLIFSAIMIYLSMLDPLNHPAPDLLWLKSRGVVRFLVLFFFGTGVLTAIAAIATITAYVRKPSSVTYLAIEFARPRLYANSILAMFNSKARLRHRMQVTSELEISSKVLFGDVAAEDATTERSPADEDITDGA
ncbi:hypothetical protein D9619_013655 [Psilocybe cf. subviscida]|uniref:DUF6534 domain-containing protein n=1 Tax=Psilocybe cf. subviscida TaxID=2480587 RepID=A0A8H5BRU1_9AGAR|nr:hypothetical protein D9619_013655 [Psilocybe cf. subviscida]